jgi:hypothetical protein
MVLWIVSCSSGTRGATEIAEGVFETARARSAGEAAARELYRPMDPAVAGLGRGLARAVAGSWRALVGATKLAH